MLPLSDEHTWIGAVIGWVDLLDPVATEKRISQYNHHPKFRGMRHLIHGEKGSGSQAWGIIQKGCAKGEVASKSVANRLREPKFPAGAQLTS